MLTGTSAAASEAAWPDMSKAARAAVERDRRRLAKWSYSSSRAVRADDGILTRGMTRPQRRPNPQVLHIDEHIVIIDKPAGILSVAGRGWGLRGGERFGRSRAAAGGGGSPATATCRRGAGGA